MSFLKYLPFILGAILDVQAKFPTLKGASKNQIATQLILLGAGVAGNAPQSDVAKIGQAITTLVPVLQGAGVMAKDAVPVHPVVQ